MKTAIYARKSTNKSGQKETIENQIKICKRYAANHGLEIVDVKMDSGSGTDDLSRPEVKELITDALAGKYDCVIMKGISRLYRDTEKGLGLIKKLDRSNIRVITVEEMFDSQENRTGAGKLDTSKITMYLMFSEMESKKLGERIKHTQIEKAHAGEWNQVSSIPFGYEYDKSNKKLIVDHSKSPIIEMIFNLYLQGKGVKSIAQYLNGDNTEGKIYPSPRGKLWSEYTVTFMIKNQVYIGNIVYNKRSKKERPYKNPAANGKTSEDVYVGNDLNDEGKWIIVENAHEAIIKKGQFDKANEMLKIKAKRKGVRNNVSLFAGIAVCDKCKKGMTFKRGRKNSQGHVVTKDNYYCMNYIRYGKQYCTSHHVGADRLEETIICDLEELMNDEKKLNSVINRNQDRIPSNSKKFEDNIKAIEKEIKKIADLMDKLLQKNLEGSVNDTQYNLMNNQYSEKLETLTQELAENKLAVESYSDGESKAEIFKRNLYELVKNIRKQSHEEKRYTFLKLIDKIYVNGDTDGIEISYKLKNPKAQ